MFIIFLLILAALVLVMVDSVIRIRITDRQIAADTEYKMLASIAHYDRPETVR